VNRRAWVAIVGAALLAPALARAVAEPLVTVYKTPACGCCAQWVEHLRSNGFQVVTRDVQTTNAERRLAGVPLALGSCHTALVGGYAIEGHVPAREIHRLLKERPNAKGLAVPGMPIGSPGMEEGGRVDRYDVQLFDEKGGTRIFATYPARMGGRP
jgi:hypothetical protein